jgi:hypothetical protein
LRAVSSVKRFGAGTAMSAVGCSQIAFDRRIRSGRGDVDLVPRVFLASLLHQGSAVLHQKPHNQVFHDREFLIDCHAKLPQILNREKLEPRTRRWRMRWRCSRASNTPSSSSAVVIQPLHSLTLALLVPTLLSLVADPGSLEYEGGAFNVGTLKGSP